MGDSSEEALAETAASAPRDAATAATALSPMPGGDASRTGALLAAGKSLGRYVIQGLLGSGGMGVVYRAHDPELGRMIALKVVRPVEATEGQTQARGRLVREAQTMAKLAHPNVIVVHDAGTVGDDVFVAMELVDGEDLGAWERAAKRTWREVVDVYLQAARGLAAAHRAGLVHRDFKPANALVGRDGRLRVLDFGLARSTLDATLHAGAAQQGSGPTAVTLTHEGAVMERRSTCRPSSTSARVPTHAAISSACASRSITPCTVTIPLQARRTSSSPTRSRMALLRLHRDERTCPARSAAGLVTSSPTSPPMRSISSSR